jgi:hypothetical protein
MEYRLEVYAPGGRNEDDCIKVLTSMAPFISSYGDNLWKPF